MTILASDIVAQAATLLNDYANIRWTSVELLGWVNAGRRAIARTVPSAFPKTASVQLAAGAKQALPADGHVLFRLNTNMGITGTTVGDAIYPASRAHLDTRLPSWRTETATDAVECYTYDEATPLEYWVYPPNTGNGRVEMTYGAIPADVAVGAAIGLTDLYQDALLDYVLYRAYSKPTDAGDTTALAAAHFLAFKDALGLGATA